jgi:hypothetical protein
LGKAVSTVAGVIQGFIVFLREALGLIISLANESIKIINLIKPGADIGSISNIAPSAQIRGVPQSATGTPFGQSGGNTINISVQAIDSEGAARAVAKVLNDSASRSVPQLYNNGIKGN